MNIPTEVWRQKEFGGRGERKRMRRKMEHGSLVEVFDVLK